MSCAPRWPACEPSSRSPWPIPTPTPAPCAWPARRRSPSADTRSGWSRPCSLWRRASAASPAGTASTSPSRYGSARLPPRPGSRRRHRLTVHLMPAVTAGDPGLIESLITNLIDNAIRHSHPDGHVQIISQAAGPQANLTVTNSGPVIPRDQIQRLFQPFQRLAANRNGGPAATVWPGHRQCRGPSDDATYRRRARRRGPVHQRAVRAYSRPPRLRGVNGSAKPCVSEAGARPSSAEIQRWFRRADGREHRRRTREVPRQRRAS